MKIRFSPVTPVVLSAFLWLAPSSLLAQPDSTSPQAIYRQAHEAMDKNNWDEAHRLLLTLWNKAHTYDVAASLSEIESVRGNYAASARYLAFALANIVPTASPAAVQRLREALEQARPHVGTVHVSVSHENAEILVDGESMGRSPLQSEVYVEPGPHRFEAKLGDQVSRRDIEAAAGQEYSVTLDLRPLSAPAGESEGPPARGLPTPLPPRGDGETGGKSDVPIYIGAGVTVVGLATWVGFGIAAKNARDNADELKHTLRSSFGASSCAQPDADHAACDELKDANERQRNRGTVSNIGFGVTLAGALATLGYVLLWSDGSRTSAAAGVRPNVTLHRSGGSVLFTGNF